MSVSRVSRLIPPFRNLLLCFAVLALGWAAQPALAQPVSAAAQAASDELPPGIQRMYAMGGVTEYRLENGLRVLLAPDAAQPNVTVNMTYLVGSRHENYGETGMAHLLEHMLFRGTPSLQDALAEFSRRGLRANGSTNEDRTNYYASFAADPTTLDWYLRWQADVMVNALIAREDLDAEMTVVRNEMEQSENSPFSILMQKLRAVAYQWHNYGKSTIGARSDVENVDIANLRDFYKLHYQPDNAVLIVTGDFDAAQALSTIHAAFASIPKPERHLPPEYTLEPVQDGERQISLHRAGGSPIIAALYRVPEAASPAYVPVELGVAILGDEPAGLLYRKLVETGLASDVFSFAAGKHQPGYALLGAVLTDTMDAAKTRDALRELLDTLSPEDFTQADLDRVRRQWLTGWDKVQANPAALASNLSEYSAMGDWRLYFLQRDLVEQATLEDVRTQTLAYLVPDNRTLGTYLPTEKPKRAPSAPQTDVNALLKDYAGREQSAAVAAFDASPANIEAQTQRKTLTLPNGPVQLALLPKPTRGQLVQASLLMQFGDVESLKETSAVADAVSALLLHGSKRLSRQEIEDRVTALQAQVSISATPGQVQVMLSTISENLPDLITLVTEILAEPSFPEPELERYKRQVSTGNANARAEPASVASRALARHDNPWPKGDVRYTPTFDEELAGYTALKTADLHRFHQRFYGAGKLAFAAVGEFDPEAVTAALEAGIKTWPEAPAFTPIPNPLRAVKPVQLTLDTPDKANAFYLTHLPLPVQDTDPDFSALLLANYLLGGSETSRLWQRVRVQDGLSYTVRSDLSASPREPSGAWSMYAIHAPDTSERLKAAFKETLSNALEQGFTDQEVAQGISAMLNYRKLNRTRDAVLAQGWINYLDLGRDFTWSARMDEDLSKLDAGKVNEVLRKYLKPEQISSALASDPGKR
ncbi:insulinase family protein [Pusillimonas sp. CC-YST705]|uniref:Insulinase family protein n=1 Tax=Mesopusillimonas faecipullorum TaxID=2755040 RepID=A0ABS8C8G6_9BURK|nr:pitrilysin family protein [Mesopusillimonas faecipullorum]MCB5362306.1 insulinase family protein [Mesopusillimonas faecipullorum]